MEPSKPRFRLPILTTCCFCIPLRTGCLLLGYFQLIAQLLGIVFSIITLVAGIVGINHLKKTQHESTFTTIHGQRFNINTDVYTANSGVNSPDPELPILILIVVAGISLLISLINFIFCIVLLVGLHQNKPKHVKAFILFSVVILVVVVILSVVGLIVGSGFSFRLLAGLVINIYCLLVIRSYYVKMTEEQEQRNTY